MMFDTWNMASFHGNRRNGFTLIELLIVVAIIAILAAIAAPMYRDFVVRSNRSDAVVSLTELANLQEKFYSNNLAYATSLGQLDYPAQSPNDYYNLSIVAATTTTYTLQAQATGSQAEDTACAEFTLNAFGQREAEDDGGNDNSQECWNR